MAMDKGKQITRYDLHEHPLVLVEAPDNENENGLLLCVCGEVISASIFSCVLCNFHLHPECAQIPQSIIPHPLHPQHGFLSFESPPELPFCLCAKCAVSSWNLIDRENESKSEFKDDGHQLPFIFLQNHKDELKRAYCSWCQESLIGPIYVSVGCKVKLHPKCFHNLPTQIAQPCHRLHPLLFHFEKIKFFCEVCQKDDDDNLVYRCLACKFDIHLECIRPRPIIEANMNHDHKFNLLRRNNPFICDACGTIDCTCVVHVKCVLEDDSLYTIIDQEDGDRDDATDSSSSIRVIKVNELGEATERGVIWRLRKGKRHRTGEGIQVEGKKPSKGAFCMKHLRQVSVECVPQVHLM
ncbi:uncharacterized protein LOC120137259 [Hibiscus syriacus]|uniref:uncharacterized protein LOC120137259 n=1 Tax=Hibiscus syriacus TaxID=106335 RepID=UPI001922B41F|nr:uncharacterized protein LOC120137259 [Hibiscus syriacus]